MIINAKAFGQIEICEKQIIHFPLGILGFENLKQYALLDSEQPPFYWLQSLDVREIAFVLINPYLFRPDYDLQIANEDYDLIRLDKADTENRLVFAIVTIPEKSEDMTANLQGPLIINKHNKYAIQSISTNPDYRVKHHILSELSDVKDSVC
ncbi:MAG: flagellar assembly protein FliW [Spirochaetales bacterium]|nr:flagellar assembly protein FliW [Spirochaetales bacterium]